MPWLREGSDTCHAQKIASFFIISTCASTLHAAGVLTVDTPDKVALALRPLVGDLAYPMFAIGIIGAGFLAVPTLAGSASSDIGGAGLNFVGIPPFRLLFYAAAVNAVLALPLMAMITLVRKNRAFVGRHVNNRFANVMGWAIVVIIGVRASTSNGRAVTSE